MTCGLPTGVFVQVVLVVGLDTEALATMNTVELVRPLLWRFVRLQVILQGRFRGQHLQV